ncbi:protein kinase, partial [bacterium]|nr:protein kinase [bacterium]
MGVAIEDIIAAKLLVQLGWHGAAAARADLLGHDVVPGSMDLVASYARNGFLSPARVEKVRRYVALYGRVRREALYAAIIEQSRLVGLQDLKRLKARLETERYTRTLGDLLLEERRITRDAHARVVAEAATQLAREDEKLLERYRRARFDGVERSVTRDPHARIETGVFTIKALFRSPESQRTQKVEAEDASARPRPAVALDAVSRTRQAELAATQDEPTPNPDVTPELARTVQDAPRRPEELARTIEEPTPILPVSAFAIGPPPRKADVVLTGKRATPQAPQVPRAIGDYEIQGVLGRGGMGIVLLGRHPEHTEPVAIKVSLSKEEEARARIKREILATSMLSHENVVQVLDAGETADGSPYLVMELVRGRELRDLMRERGAFAPRDALAIFVQILGAAGAAHRAGIVHRDLKPENVL